MTCPHCGFQFPGFITNVPVQELPAVMPGVCTECASLFLTVKGKTRTLLPGELDELRKSEVWPWLEEMMVKIGNAIKAKQAEQLSQCKGRTKPILN